MSRATTTRPSTAPPLHEPEDSGAPPDPRSPFAEREAEARRVRVQDPPRAKRLRFAAIRAWIVVLGMIAVAVWGGMRLTEERLAMSAELHLGTATLMATSMNATAGNDGEVVEILADPADFVQRGTPLARLRIFESDGSTPLRTVMAPLDGIVTAVLAREGGAVEAGSPVVEIFDPASARFEVTVDAELLGRLAHGMRATLTSSAVSEPIEAIVSDVRAPVSIEAADSSDGSELPILVLTPRDTSQIEMLLPGLRFEAIVDTESVNDETPSIVRVDT